MRTLALVSILLLAAPVAAAYDSHMSIDGDRCSAGNFHFDDQAAYVAKETIDAGSIRSLRTTVRHAPVKVTGDGGSGYRIDVCKAARRPEDLAAIRVFVDDGSLSAVGPDDRRWVVTYHIHAPRGADLEVEAENGPLSIRDVEGKVVARTANGPLSLENVSGHVEATTSNGPVNVRGGSGSITVRASNGPLSVDLEGVAWSGGTLDAATKNGPLRVTVPRGFGSGITVESSGRGPVSCRAEGCERARRGWGDEEGEPRRIQLGSGAEAVRLSTVNGPITIREE